MKKTDDISHDVTSRDVHSQTPCVRSYKIVNVTNLSPLYVEVEGINNYLKRFSSTH